MIRICEQLLLPKPPSNQDGHGYWHRHGPKDPELIAHNDAIAILSHGEEGIHAEDACEGSPGKKCHCQDGDTFHLERVTPCGICDGLHGVSITFGNFKGVLLHQVVQHAELDIDARQKSIVCGHGKECGASECSSVLAKFDVFRLR